MTQRGDSVRVMWLLNHRTARAFEAKMLRSIGIDEIFYPKIIEPREDNMSAGVDRSYDEALTISDDELSILNQADWYASAGAEAWEIANRRFGIVCCGLFPRQIEDVTRHFRGPVLLRVYGRENSSYSDALYHYLGIAGVERIRRMGDRFWFGQAHENLHDIEHDFLRRRSCYLPLGITDSMIHDQWQGTDARVFFVCPRIGTSTYYEEIYRSFRRNFAGLPYVIGGAQPIKISDDNVLGFVPRDVHDDNMRRLRVMYYHGDAPNHVHFHPFEAVCAGMPLVFMAGGMLDDFGGEGLPGRCTSIGEARQKLERLLAGDNRFSDLIRTTQVRLLDKRQPERCEPIWRKNFAKVLAPPQAGAVVAPAAASRRPRVAVILPIKYRGGTLRGAKLVAKALHRGSRLANAPVDVVFAHPPGPTTYTATEFADLDPDIPRRMLQWEFLNRAEAQRALRYSGSDLPLTHDRYAVPSDGINHFLDCDLWVFISDRLDGPLLPLRPYAVVVYDYLQRYQPIMPPGADLQFLLATRNAGSVLVTTRFTFDDAAQYAGIDPARLHLVPMLIPRFDQPASTGCPTGDYFLWSTNPSLHKNHFNAVEALRTYFETLAGKLECRVSGFGVEDIFKGRYPHVEPVKAMLDASPALQQNITILGAIPDALYWRQLRGAQFLFHPSRIDNGTFSVIEAAQVGVPALSTDYPAMREIDENYHLRLAWCDADDPIDMAAKLKHMEEHAASRRADLPSRESFDAAVSDDVARAYWEAVRQCL